MRPPQQIARLGRFTVDLLVKVTREMFGQNLPSIGITTDMFARLTEKIIYTVKLKKKKKNDIVESADFMKDAVSLENMSKAEHITLCGFPKVKQIELRIPPIQ